MATKLITIIMFCYLVFIGCYSSKIITIKYHDKIKNASDYFDTLSNLTQTQKVLVNLKTNTHLTVTYKNWELRKAYIKEITKQKSLPIDAQKTLLENEQKEFDKFISFVICIYTPNVKWSELAEKNSIWNIVITNKNNNEDIKKPVSIIQLDNKDPTYNYFYPYINNWCSLYEIKFDVLDNIDNFTLLFSGLYTKVAFLWKK